MSVPDCSRDRKSNAAELRCAVLTGRGRSAIAVIGLSGAGAEPVISRGFRPATPHRLAVGQVRYGQWTGWEQPSLAAESVVITPLAEDRFEIQCHGGRAAVARILDDLRSAGAEEIDAFSWQPAGDELQREARRTLAGCLTPRTAAVALDQLRGAMAVWVERWLGVLSAAPTALSDGSPRQLREEAAAILGYQSVGLHLTQPYRIVLTGPPNVGKSTLMNLLVGYDRSIIDDQAGTTRDVLHADTVIEGLPVRLSDTAGVRVSDEQIERAGMARAVAAAADADLILVVTSPDHDPLDSFLAGEGPAAAHLPAADCLWVHNKIDRLRPPAQPPPGSIGTQGLTGEGIATLWQAIADRLAPNWPSAGQPVPMTARQVQLLSRLARPAPASAAEAWLQALLSGTA